MAILVFWEKAVPLNRAFVSFARSEDAERYRDLVDSTSVVAILERAKQNVAAGEEPAKALSRAAGRGGELIDFRRKLEKQCIDWVKLGRLVAYGFANPRKPADDPVKVPADLWDGFVNWNKSTVEYNGLKMQGVRLIQHTMIEKTRGALPPSSEGRGQGRRTRKPQILVAFEALYGDGLIDFEKPMAELYPQIREWVLHAHPDDPDGEKGLDNKTIQKHIAKLFQSRKHDSKL